MADDFNFDTSQLNKSQADLVKMDQEFLQAMQDKVENSEAQSTDDAFTFWFLIVLLILFIFFIVVAIVMVVKGRRRRYEYSMVGYK
jgi:heme/copper-type cytochrome/quinol oxidase subunit 2